MGSLFSRKERRNEREVKEANSRGIFLGCMLSADLSSDSSTTLTCSSFSCNKNGSTVVAHLTDKNLPDETHKGNGRVYVERYSSVGSEFRIDNIRFSTVYCSRSLFHNTALTTSSDGRRSFEPTPLTQILPQLYLGSEQDAQQAEKLIGLGITHIISIVGGGRYKDLYPKHKYIPLRDNGTSNLLAEIDNSYDFAMESQEPGNKLFIHCQLGQNRSASFLIGFLMKSTKLSFYEAYALLKEKRELIHPHKKYVEQLRQLDLELHKVHSTPENFLDIALCSKEGIKILHQNFSKADSELLKISQRPKLKEVEDELSSLSSSKSQVRKCDKSQSSTIYLRDCNDSQDISDNSIQEQILN